MFLQYKIYYDDGTRFDGDTSNIDMIVPPNNRKFGVLVIVQQDSEMNWEIVCNADFYLFFGDTWIGVDKLGLIDYVLYCLSSIKCVLVGRMVPYLIYRDILEKAQREMNPPKTAYRPNEQI